MTIDEPGCALPQRAILLEGYQRMKPCTCIHTRSLRRGLDARSGAEPGTSQAPGSLAGYRSRDPAIR
jgi:hypothetical protein